MAIALKRPHTPTRTQIPPPVMSSLPSPPRRENYGTKRRRQKSDGTIAKAPSVVPSSSVSREADTSATQKQTSRSNRRHVKKKSTIAKSNSNGSIPVFLSKLYEMIDTCDPSVASWTENGEMFVIKNPDIFESTIIPNFFDHSKFTSFARQLNFYGFRKVHSKPIRNTDLNPKTAKQVMFHNSLFKRGRQDLLGKIQRSTRGNCKEKMGSEEEVEGLKKQVMELEGKIERMTLEFERRLGKVERDFERRIVGILNDRGEAGGCNACKNGCVKSDEENVTVDESESHVHFEKQSDLDTHLSTKNDGDKRKANSEEEMPHPEVKITPQENNMAGVLPSSLPDLPFSSKLNNPAQSSEEDDEQSIEPQWDPYPVLTGSPPISPTHCGEEGELNELAQFLNLDVHCEMDNCIPIGDDECNK